MQREPVWRTHAPVKVWHFAVPCIFVIAAASNLAAWVAPADWQQERISLLIAMFCTVAAGVFFGVLISMVKEYGLDYRSHILEDEDHTAAGHA